MKIHIPIPFLVMGALILIACTAVPAYQFGTRAQADENRVLTQRLEERENRYSDSIAQLRLEKDRTSSDYRTACFEFQRLHETYKKLKLLVDDSQTTATSYTAPDSARGNEDSCYR